MRSFSGMVHNLRGLLRPDFSRASRTDQESVPTLFLAPYAVQLAQRGVPAPLHGSHGDF